MEEKTVPAPCGAICQNCRYFGNECKGCYACKGEVWWIVYTDLDVCEQYDCCKLQSGFRHCGECNQFPCDLYAEEDPEMTPEENAERRASRIRNIKEWIEDDEANDLGVL